MDVAALLSCILALAVYVSGQEKVVVSGISQSQTAAQPEDKFCSKCLRANQGQTKEEGSA